MTSEMDQSGADWRANLREASRERAEGARQRALGRQWIDEVLDSPESFQEIGAFGQHDAVTDALICGWGLVHGAPAFVIADCSAPDAGSRTSTGAAKVSRIHQLAADRGVPVVELVTRQVLDERNFVGAELGIWGYGVDFRGLRRLRRAVPRAVVVDGPITAQSCMDAALADYVVLGPNGAIGLQKPARPSAENCGASGVDWVAEHVSQATQRVLTFIGLVTKPVQEPVAAAAGASLSGVLHDEGSYLEIAPVEESGLRLGICRVDGVTVATVCLDGGPWLADGYRRLENFLGLCERRRLNLLMIVSSPIDETCVLPRESARVARAIAQTHVPICHLLGIDVLPALTAQLCGYDRSRLVLPMDLPVPEIRQQVGAVLRDGHTSPASPRQGRP